MKQTIFINCLLIFLTVTAFSQSTKAFLYKSDHWLDIKGKGGLQQANDDPTYEKVEILKTDKYIKVTFGDKIYNYRIISSKQFSSVLMNYNVTLNSKPFVLSISGFYNGAYGININKNWIVFASSMETIETSLEENKSKMKDATLDISQSHTRMYSVNASETHHVFFHNSPNPTTIRKGYFDAKETVEVIKIENGFGYVEFTNPKGQT